MNLVGVGLKKKLNSFNWRDLSENKALPWSLELIEKFEDKWSWYRLSDIPWLNVS